jgi:putative ABC transport system ATP-binding protein
MTSLLTARAVHKSFARTEALRGVSLAVAAGEVVAVTGPSRSGKSTLLLCLAGILRPESGELTFDGRRIDRMGEPERSVLRRREFGIVLQFGQLLPELTAVQDVALPLLLEGHPRAESHRAATSWLDRLGVAGLADASPAELSGSARYVQDSRDDDDWGLTGSRWASETGQVVYFLGVVC